MINIIGKSITKKVITKTILKDINVFLPGGGITGLIGASGSGKSTLLRILALLDNRFSGEISYNLNINRDHYMKRIGYVHQFDILNPNLDVWTVLYYSYRIRNSKKVSDDTIKENILSYLKRFNISEKLYSRLCRLSGGERKRVHIINELLANPFILFLDEPLSGLDPANSYIITKFLREYARQGNIVVMTTHSTESIDYLNKLYFLSGGHLVFYGKPDEILDYFKTDNLAQTYQKTIRQKDEFLLRKFKGSSYYRDLMRYINGSNYQAMDIDGLPYQKSDDSECDRTKKDSSSINDEYSKLLRKIKDETSDE